MSNAKIHSSLREALSRAAMTAAGEEEKLIPVIIRYRALRDQPLATMAAASAIEPQRIYQILPCVAAEIPPNEIQRLVDDPQVERIWYDMPVHALLDVSVPHIGVTRVWERGDEGGGVRVAILDTGCDLNHPDLQDRVQDSVDFSGKGSAQDGNGHGTHVAGIVAGTGLASNGRYRGVAPGADLYIAKVLDDEGNGRMSDVMAGLDWAIAQQAQIVNLSLGSDVSCDGTDALSEACDAAVGKGLVVVVAAGNSGPGSRTVGSPGCAREVMTVGASSDDDQVANFSSRGPTSDGRVKPDIVAPGVNIISARAAGTSLGSGQVSEFYTSLSGTSMATPHVSGVAALLLAAEPSLTPRQIKEIFKETAVDLELSLNTQGAGRIDAFAAWRMATEGDSPEPTPPPPPPPTPEPTPEPSPEPPPSQPPTGCLGFFLVPFRKLRRPGQRSAAKRRRSPSFLPP